MPGPPDYDGVCRNCGLDEYVCHCPEPDLIASAVYYAVTLEGVAERTRTDLRTGRFDAKPVCPCSSLCHVIPGIRHAAPCCQHCGLRWDGGTWHPWIEDPGSAHADPA